MPSFAARLRRRWAVRAPHVVHAHFWMSGWAPRPPHPAGVPVVQTFHALGVVKRRHQGVADTSPSERHAIEAELAQRVDHIVATSSDERSELLALGADPERISVVPCGIDPAMFRPDGPVAPRRSRRRAPRHRIVTVSRLVPRKGIADVIAALPGLPDAELVIAGEPPADQLDADPEARRLRELAEAAAVADRVRLVGALTRAASSRSSPWRAAPPSWAAPSAACPTPSSTAARDCSCHPGNPRRSPRPSGICSTTRRCAAAWAMRAPPRSASGSPGSRWPGRPSRSTSSCATGGHRGRCRRDRSSSGGAPPPPLVAGAPRASHGSSGRVAAGTGGAGRQARPDRALGRGAPPAAGGRRAPAGGRQRRQRSAGPPPRRRAGRALRPRAPAVQRAGAVGRDRRAHRDRQRLRLRPVLRPPGRGPRPARRRVAGAVDLGRQRQPAAGGGRSPWRRRRGVGHDGAGAEPAGGRGRRRPHGRLRGHAQRAGRPTGRRPPAVPRLRAGRVPIVSRRPVSVTVVGDALLDVDWVGSVDRVCADAPVPVLDMGLERHRPGGAGLAARCAAQAGAAVTLVTAVGGDQAGARLRDELAADGVRVVDLGLDGPTPVKLRLRAGGQSLVRVDQGCSPVWAPGAWIPEATAAVEGAEAVLVSDYGRGLAALAAFRAVLDALLTETGRRVPVVWDPHRLGPEPPAGLDVLVPNLDEARRLAGEDAGMEGRRADASTQEDHRPLADLVAGRFGCPVALTLGERGAVLAHPGRDAEVVPVDPVAGGAGDRFAATVAVDRARGVDLFDTVRHAVAAARDQVAGTWSAPASPRPAAPGSARAGAVHDPLEWAASLRAAGGPGLRGCRDGVRRGHPLRGAAPAEARRLRQGVRLRRGRPARARRARRVGRRAGVAAGDRRALDHPHPPGRGGRRLMATVLGVNAVFHDPAAALVIDGETVAAAEEERFSRRKHGKEPVPFSTWELPVDSMRWCLAQAGLEPADADAVGYSYDPDLAPVLDEGDITQDGWEGLRTLYAHRAPRFLATALPGLAAERVSFVPHHVAHAGSTCWPRSDSRTRSACSTKR